MEKSYDYLKELIRDIPDFPIEGVLFRDITTLLNNKEAFSLLMNHWQHDNKMSFEYNENI